jgi:transcriptional regulator with XRE-family HTH domain
MEDEPTNPLRVFGEELRAWRKRSGMHQFDVAKKLIISDSLEGAIERATRLPQRRVAEASDMLFDTPGTFIRLWKLIMQRSFPLRYGPYAELEADATRIHVWEIRGVPGLLQTPDYARAIIKAGAPLESDDVIDEDVATRMARQQIFAKGDAPLAWFVIDESVLYRAHGGKKVMCEQIHKLITMAEYPRVVIQVLPYAITIILE